jgi:hypothetical protein
MEARWKIGQSVTVYPTTWLLRRLTGFTGEVDTVELDEDAAGANGTCELVYRVKLEGQPGQGYPYRSSELREVINGQGTELQRVAAG